ncbi:MAG: transglycosylase domain-containing protein [Acidimicrobiales bacterium]
MRTRRAIPADHLKTSRSGKVKRRNVLWRWRRWLFLLGLLVVAGIAGVGYVLSRIELPGPPPESAQTTFVCDASVPIGRCSAANALAELHGEEDRVFVPLERVPQLMQDALLAAEDRDFFEHGGVDPVGIARAAWADIRKGGAEQGGSTITQQYVKVTYLSDERSLQRKLKEAVMSIKFEQQYSKPEILERYLNTVYFGRGAYGIQAASRAYFGHDVEQLTLPESALLAGLIRAPATAEPYRYPEEAMRRRRTVLTALLEEEKITKQEFAVADSWPFHPYNGLIFPEQSVSVEVRRGANSNDPATYAATQYFVEHVRKQLVQAYTEDRVYGGGLRVYTTLDLGMQKAAFDAVTSTLDRPDDPAGALVAIDDQGQVKAMMGGRDYQASKVNLATGERGGGSGRQPGSTFKAFALAEAVREGYAIDSVYRSPSDLVLPGADGGKDWEIEGGCCGGRATLVQATEDSVNTVYAQLMVDLGADKVVQMAHDLGVTAPLSDPVPSYVLGSGEVSVLDLAAGYSTFANQGTRITPRAIVRVERADGTLVEDFAPERSQVLTPDQTAKVTYCLQRVVRYGTGRSAQIVDDQAGKTGTTTNNKDAWFAGYTPRLTAVAWMGHVIPREMDSVHGLTVEGGNFPAQMWRRFMEQVLQGYDTGVFPERPDDLFEGEDLNPDLTITIPRQTSTSTRPRVTVPSSSAPASSASTTAATSSTSSTSSTTSSTAPTTDTSTSVSASTSTPPTSATSSTIAPDDGPEPAPGSRRLPGRRLSPSWRQPHGGSGCGRESTTARRLRGDPPGRGCPMTLG